MNRGDDAVWPHLLHQCVSVLEERDGGETV